MAFNVGRTFLVQHLHLGEKGSVYTFNQTYLPQGGQLGQVFEQNGKFFRLVQFDDGTGNVAAVDGGVLYWKTKFTAATPWVVTSDASDGEALANGVAGGCHVVAVDQNYIFVQCGGDQAAVQVAASAVKGDHLTGHASTDLILTRTAGGTAPIDKLVATALTSRGTTTSDNGASVSNSSKVRWEFGALI